MGKITGLPQALSFDEGDVLVKDGEHGTKQIPVSEAAKYMGRDTIMVNEQPTEGTKVVIQTTGQEYSLALMSDVNAVNNKVDEVKTQLIEVDHATERIIGNDLFRSYKNLFDITTVQYKKRINTATGNADGINSQPNTYASDFIPVTAGKEYQLGYSFYSSGDYGLAFYDSSKVYLSGLKQAIGSGVVDNSLPFNFVAPTGASYVRFTGVNGFNIYLVEYEKALNIKELIDKECVLIDASFEIGKLVDGVETADNSMLRSEIIHATSDMILHCTNGYKYQIAYFTSGNVFIRQTPDVTTDTFVHTGTYFRIVLKHNAYYISKNEACNIMMYNNSAIADWRYQNLDRYGKAMLNLELEKGMLNTNGTNNDESRYQYAYRTPDYVTFDAPIVLRCDGLFKCRVIAFDDNNTRTGTTAVTSETGPLYLASNMKYKFAIYYNDYNYSPIENFWLNIYNDVSKIGEIESGLLGTFDFGYYSGSSLIKSSNFVTSELCEYDFPIIIKANSNWLFAVLVFEDGAVVWNSHNLYYDIAVPANTSFKVQIRSQTLSAVENLISVLNDFTIEKITDTKPDYDWWMEMKGVAHGGYDQHAPFNTLPSFKMAIEAGMKYMETDLRFTSDGVPVLLHDATIDSMTDDASGAIADMTYEQVMQYDFGTKFNPSFAGTHICTLEELVKLCRDTQSYLYLEFKVTPTEEQFTQIKNMIIGTMGLDKVTIAGVDYDLMRNVWTHFDNPRIAYVMTAEKVANFTQAFYELSSFKTNNNVIASVWIPGNNDWSKIKAIFDAGFPVLAGTSHIDSVALTLPNYVSEMGGSVNYPEVLREAALAD